MCFFGKEKARKHKRYFPAIARLRGGLPTGWPGYVLCAEPKEHKHFCPGSRPVGSVTGVTEKLFMCQMFVCLFWPPLTLQHLLFVEKSKGNPPKKARVFSLRGTPKILGKRKAKRTKKQGESDNKKKGNRKKQGLEGQGSEKIAATFGPQKCPVPPKSLAIFPCNGKSLAIAILFAMF